MADIQVTTVIPTCNRWSILSTAALPSALAQEGVAQEVIVVDDGSRDGTAERVRRLKDGVVRAIRHERPLGVAKARNTGIAAAQGEWIAFLDDDDLWAPRKLGAQLDIAVGSGADLAYAGAVAVDERRRPLFAFPLPPADGLAARLLRWNDVPAGGSNVITRAELLRQLGGFDEQLFQLADWDLWIRLALAGVPAACDEILVGYVVHERSMLLTDRRDVFAELEYLARKHQSARAELGVELNRALFWRWVARGHRRAGRRRLAARTYLAGARRHRDPGAVLRAVGALFGERANTAGRAAAMLVGRQEVRPVPEPEWLSRYR